MDVIVTPSEEGSAWTLTDLLGRSMGRVVTEAAGRVMIRPEGHAIETMTGMRMGPHSSLDAALAEIEKHTRGTCRHESVAQTSPTPDGSGPANSTSGV